MDKDDIDNTFSAFQDLASNLILSGVDPLIVAGSMSAAGMQMYKAILTEKDFKKMQKTIATQELPDV